MSFLTNHDHMDNSVKEWYNEFSVKQISTSINLRHYTIFNKAIQNGLKKNSKILEIGCGIGTLTSLLYKFISKGHIVAADISDESINVAKKRLGISSRIDFKVTDMSDFKYENKFDFIILPDVLEHIPIEQHKNLFDVISKHMFDHSTILINIPHPKAIEFLRETSPEKLQIIDQAISADTLLKDAYANDLILISYESYSIFNKENDYAFITMKKNVNINLTQKSKYWIIIQKQINKIRYWWSLIF